MSKECIIDIKHPRFNDEFFGFKKIEKFFIETLNKKKYQTHIYSMELKEQEKQHLHTDQQGVF